MINSGGSWYYLFLGRYSAGVGDCPAASDAVGGGRGIPILDSRPEEEDRALKSAKALAVLRDLGDTALGPPRWRVSPEPFWIGPEETAFLQELGNHLLSFYQTLNDLYYQSVRGRVPRWIADYLDLGKPEELVAYGRMNRFKAQLPGIIRPDLILTDGGMACTELDSVPGGFGLTACLAGLYTRQGHEVLGGSNGMVEGFARMIREAAGLAHPHLAIIVSEESKEYRPEMRWLSEALSREGVQAAMAEPSQVRFTEEGLFLHREEAGDPWRIHVVYRFFELFDLKNIPRTELLLYGAKKGLFALTPPAKAFLEEKMAFALFHHPGLHALWRERLGEESFSILKRLLPRTWILDPREVPPHAVIAGLETGGRPVGHWDAIKQLGQKERRFIVKPSGFSPLAWGSRGVKVGHDLSGLDWRQGLEEALAGFEHTPYVLQAFHKGRRVQVSYYDGKDGVLKSMAGRVRLSPYYFVADGKARFSGALATVCPLDKKLLHGMTEAVMVPCGLRAKGDVWGRP